jgi:hypothetical protein
MVSPVMIPTYQQCKRKKEREKEKERRGKKGKK